MLSHRFLCMENSWFKDFLSACLKNPLPNPHVTKLENRDVFVTDLDLEEGGVHGYAMLVCLIFIIAGHVHAGWMVEV